MRAHFVHIEQDFTKPPERIFAYLAQPENLAQLVGATVSDTRDGEPVQSAGLGSRRQLKIGPLPAFEETVTEFQPPERIVYQITAGTPLGGHVGTMLFLPERDGTRFVHDIRLASHVPGLAAIVRVALRRSIVRSLPTVERGA